LMPESEEDEDKPPTVDLGSVKPKPPFLPPASRPTPGDRPRPPPPNLNPGSFKPQRPPAGPFGEPSSTHPPIDGEDDPHILFPFLPKFPDYFKCPLTTVMLPIIGDCDSVIACIAGVGHRLRCPEGEIFDVSLGRCIRNTDYICPSAVNILSGEETEPSINVIYAYLPVSKFNHLLKLDIK